MEKINYSFIIPHKNDLARLRRCVKSIPERSDIEIIIVDDNSDASQKPTNIIHSNLIIKNYSDSNGAGFARNIGKSIARGKWLLFADSDDYYVKGFIDDLDLVKESNVDIVYFDFYYLYDYQTGKYLDHLFARNIKNYIKDSTLINNIRFGLNAPWNKMFRKSFVEQNKAEFEEIPIGNDAWFVCYCGAKAQNIQVLDKKLYYYTKNTNGITYRKSRPIEDIRMLFKSEIRVNELKIKCNAWDTIVNPFYQFSKYKQIYGYFAVVKLYAYKLSKINYLKIYLHKMLIKMRNRNSGTIKLD